MKSELGKGATFFFTLLAAETKSQEKKQFFFKAGRKVMRLELLTRER
jgi:hypothetical protein